MKMRTIQVVAWRLLFLELGFFGICTAQTGFTSIDCGKESPDYVDGLGISWRNDSTYIDGGLNGAIPVLDESQWQFPRPLNSTLRDFRYFPHFRAKQCYEIPVLQDATYVVRATFLHGENPALQLPIRFDVSINGTVWTSIQFDEKDNNNDNFSSGFSDAVTREIVFYSSHGTVVFICLIRGTGSPFISSLELRHIDNVDTVSPFDNDRILDGKYLRDGVLYNAGADPGASDVRFPEDSMDRIWKTPDANLSSRYPDMKGTTTLNSTENVIVPFDVMRDAWGADGTTNLSILYDVVRGDGLVAIVSTQELSPNASALNVRGMKISLNFHGLESFRSDNATASQNPNLVTNVNASADLNRLELVTSIPTNWSGPVTLSWEREEWSNLGPIVNAVEMYTVAEWDSSRTQQKDESVLRILQAGLNLTNWHFDPCFPVAETWIECNVTSGTVTKIDVTGNRVPFEFPAAFNENLWSLESLETVIMDRTNISVLDLTWWRSSLKRIEADTPGSSIQQLSLVNSSVATILPAFNLLADQIARMLCGPHANALKGGILLGGSPFCEDGRKSLGNQYSEKDIEIAFRYFCRFSKDDLLPIPDMSFCTTSDTNSGMEKHIIIVVATTTGALTLLSLCVCLGLMWKMRKQKKTLDERDQALAEQRVQPRFYSYDDLKVATRDFHQSMKLGKGAFGAVYKGKLRDGTFVAVKKLFHSKQLLEEFFDEVVLVTGIKHRNLVQLKGCCIKDNQRFLVYEFAENKNLTEALWDPNRPTRIFLNWQERLNICVGIARGLSYLHEELQPPIIHTDIKPANILLDENYQPKIADFGISQPPPDEEDRLQSFHLAGTSGRGYFSPEYATQGELTEKADVFSYGVLVLEIVSGRKCIDHNMPHEQAFLINWAQELYAEGASSLLKLVEPQLRAHWRVHDNDDVIRVLKIGLSCLHFDPARRPSMSMVVTMLLGNMDVIDIADSRSRANLMSFGSFLEKSRLPPPSSTIFTHLGDKHNEEEEDENQRKHAQRRLILSVSRHDSSIIYNFHPRHVSFADAATAYGLESPDEDHEDAEFETPLNPSSSSSSSVFPADEERNQRG